MRYALPTQSKYPIETEAQVKTASAYFSKYMNQFHPAERMAMATNLEKRASELGMFLDNGNIYNYSRTGNQYSPDFDMHMSMRKQAAVGITVRVGNTKVNAGDMMDKIASLKASIQPTQMVDLISDFDKRAGLEPKYDHGIRDPFYTVYGSSSNPRFDREKLASDFYADELKRACDRNEAFMAKIAEAFGSDFAAGLKADPVSVYQSMPVPERELIVSTLKDNQKA